MSYALIPINTVAWIPRHDYVHLINTFKNNKNMNLRNVKIEDPYTYPRWQNTTTERKIQFWKKETFWNSWAQTEFHASRQSSYLIRKPFNSKSMVYKYFIATESETPSDCTWLFFLFNWLHPEQKLWFKQWDIIRLFNWRGIK